MAAAAHGAALSRVLRLSRQVWVRAAAFTAIAVAVALAAGLVGPLAPVDIRVELGQNSVESLLQIIATAMLTATTFSITAMVTAYSSATTTATPRSTQLLITDPTSQNALSTFVGAFVFSLVGIIALSTDYYTEQGRTILFVGTLVVIAIVVVTLLRWIAHLARFGRMADVIDRVEQAPTRSLLAYASSPTLGARRLGHAPADAVAVWAESTGYVAHIDVAALDRVGRGRDIEVVVAATPGTIADDRSPLALLSGSALRDDDVRVDAADAVRGAFRLAPHRDYEQDPRLGVIALTEIGSRALSPATNDPGTAIEVIAALQRVFTEALRTDRDPRVEFEHVSIAPPRLSDLVSDSFQPLARDDAGILEVQIRLQKCLAALAATAPHERETFARAAADAQRRARGAMDGSDRRVLRREAADAWRSARSIRTSR
ncbi:MAG: DUF2254 domain-containing protein [Microbacterium arborescens]